MMLRLNRKRGSSYLLEMTIKMAFYLSKSCWRIANFILAVNCTTMQSLYMKSFDAFFVIFLIYNCTFAFV